jgi:hypothetical protein
VFNIHIGSELHGIVQSTWQTAPPPPGLSPIQKRDYYAADAKRLVRVRHLLDLYLNFGFALTGGFTALWVASASTPGLGRDQDG